MRLKTALLAGLLLSASLGQASTINPAFGLTAVPNSLMTNGSFDNVLGWSFTVTAPITVNALGRFDATLVPWVQIALPPWDGNREVALWNSEGTLLASASVAPDAPGQDIFRWAEISPVALNPGNGYIIATPLPGGEYFAFTYRELMVINPAVEFAVSVAASGLVLDPGTFEFIHDSPDFAYLGPMFFILDASGPDPGAPIPEPGTWTLMLAGVAAVAGLRLRGRRA